MARPLSDDKRTAIFEAAAEVVGALGVAAPTARIARGAGVAEGTLFTYFAAKDVLLNQLYLWIKAGLRDALMADYPSSKSLPHRCRHVWDRYIAWGGDHPLQRKAARQLAVSDRITDESRTVVADLFSEFNALMRECAAHGPLKDQPTAFVSSIFSAIAETTMEFIAREPKRARQYTSAGFEAFWKAVAG
jgi:AcrR family transcriptional regulator